MSTKLRLRLLGIWRRIPLWAKLLYAAGWLLSSAWFSTMFQASGAHWPRLDLLVLWPFMLGAVWPISVLLALF